MTNLIEQLGSDYAVEAIVFTLVVGGIGFLALAMRAFARDRSVEIDRRIDRVLSDEKPSADAVRIAAPSAQSGLIDAALKPFAQVAKPTDAQELDSLRSRLAHAGYRTE